jgi:hypothetical protein
MDDPLGSAGTAVLLIDHGVKRRCFSVRPHGLSCASWSTMVMSRAAVSPRQAAAVENRAAPIASPMRVPGSPLLVQVLFPDARTPFPSLHVVGRADFKGAVACGVVRGVADSEEDVPVWRLPHLRAKHPTPV